MNKRYTFTGKSMETMKSLEKYKLQKNVLNKSYRV